MTEQQKWTKHCQKCHSTIPDDHVLCDFHLREKYGLLEKGVFFYSRGTLYPKDVVLAALRTAEQCHDH